MVKFKKKFLNIELNTMAFGLISLEKTKALNPRRVALASGAVVKVLK